MPHPGGSWSIKGDEMTQTETFQLSLAAAEAYESKFVPALFGEWAPLIIAAAGVTTGQEVLDVACGTGVVARGGGRHQRGHAHRRPPSEP
jgi:2-polyprenyl-3-methyl-5-hydroxy-6-metoxy-1,4-benzoquinol methylase